MPFVAPHLALMPDAHLGKGATVGLVVGHVEDTVGQRRARLLVDVLEVLVAARGAPHQRDVAGEVRRDVGDIGVQRPGQPLERIKKDTDRDFFLAFSPERVDPGNPVYNTRNTPKVMGGITEWYRNGHLVTYRAGGK